MSQTRLITLCILIALSTLFMMRESSKKTEARVGPQRVEAGCGGSQRLAVDAEVRSRRKGALQQSTIDPSLSDEIRKVRNDTVRPTCWKCPSETVVHLNIDDGVPRWPINVPYDLTAEQLEDMRGCYHQRTCLQHVKFLRPAPTNAIMGLTNALLDVIGSWVIGSLTNLVILPQERGPALTYVPEILDLNATRINLACLNIVMLTVEEYNSFFWDSSEKRVWVDLASLLRPYDSNSELESLFAELREYALQASATAGKRTWGFRDLSLKSDYLKPFFQGPKSKPKAGVSLAAGTFLKFMSAFRSSFAADDWNLMLLPALVFNKDIRDAATRMMEQMRSANATRLVAVHVRIEADALRWANGGNHVSLDRLRSEMGPDMRKLCRDSDCGGIYVAAGDLGEAEYELLRNLVPGKPIWFKSDFANEISALRNRTDQCTNGSACETFHITSASEAAVDALILQHASVSAHMNPLTFVSTFAILIQARRNRARVRSGAWRLSYQQLVRVFQGITPRIPAEMVLVPSFLDSTGLPAAQQEGVFDWDTATNQTQVRKWMYEGLMINYKPVPLTHLEVMVEFD